MAYKKNTYKRKKGKYSQLERLAYQMGQIDKGLTDSNTRVYDSFQAGCTATKRKKKPLF